MSQNITFEEALKQTEGKEKNLLLGNGFSIAQTEGEFSYKNLLGKSGLDPSDSARLIFEALDTVDFELVIEALEHAAKVSDVYGFLDKRSLFESDASRVRNSLVGAIEAVHPSMQHEIPEVEIESCGKFISEFSQIFTLNYDLLLYWVFLNMKPVSYSDGFGLGEKENGFRTFSDKAHCSVFYLHGGLHLFQTDTGDTLKKISSGDKILLDIKAEIRKGNLPLFVAEGSSKKKLAKIKSTPYLRHGLDTLRDQKAPIFIFGHSADLNDEHIYDAIFSGGSESVYFCVFGDESDIFDIKNRLGKFSKPNILKKIHYIDANSMNIWGK